MPAADGLAERVRRDPRPRRRRLPARARPTWSVPAARRYLPGHDGARDQLGHPRRLDHRARRAADRPVAPRGRALAAPTAARRPTTTPTTCCCACVRCVNGEVQVQPRLRAGVRLRPQRRQVGVHGRRLPRGASPAPTGSDVELLPDHRHERRLRGPARHRAHADEGGRHRVRRAVVVRAPPRRRPTTRPTSGCVWTAHHWQHWLDHGEFPDHPWRTYLQRSALTLKGLSYAPTGALLAAATTSLPETPGGERNWDYRYTWIRDSTFTLWGLYTLGLRLGGQRLLLLHRRRGRGGGGPAPDHVRHRRRARARRGDARPPVRLRGRAARCGSATAPTTRTSTTCGARCSTRSTCTPSRATTCPSGSGRSSSSRSRPRSSNWREPDRGIWEVRGEPKHFTSSKLMCWVALDRGARLAEIREDARAAPRSGRRPPTRSTPTSARTASTTAACSRQHYDTDALDASVLLMPLVRFLPPDDERIRRHRAGDRRRADRGRAGAALPRRRDRRRAARARRARSRSARSGWCRRWSRSASSTRARALCEKLLSYASPLGLYAEEIDPRSGRHLGNFPQAFTHLALINAVMHVIRADEELEAERVRPRAQADARAR